jgi:hypothetical protein
MPRLSNLALSAPYRPASHAGVPAPLVPLNPPSQEAAGEAERLPRHAGSRTSATRARCHALCRCTGGRDASRDSAAPPAIKTNKPDRSSSTSATWTSSKARSNCKTWGLAARRVASGRFETSGRIEVVKQHYPDGKLQIEREVTQDLEGTTSITGTGDCTVPLARRWLTACFSMG